MRTILLAIGLLALTAPATAETMPPGDYSQSGRIVRTAQGSIEVFDGHGCMLLLNEELQEKLVGHLGEVVRVDYTRVEWTEGMVLNMSGAPIGKIRKITTLAKTPASLPVAISVRPLKDAFPVGEPIGVELTLTNTTDNPVAVDRRSVGCHLLQNFRWKLSLGGEGRHSPTRRRRPKEIIEPGAKLVFNVQSAWMAEPGAYDVVATLPDPDSTLLFQSEASKVTVLPARDAADELAALRAWLSRASPSQRIDIAGRLIKLGDDRGVDVVLALFRDRGSWGSYTYAHSYRFLWEHGGERGEAAMLEELASKTEQHRALRVIEGVEYSSRKIEVLEGFLADRRETRRSSSGWCDEPRICDITAQWLAGYTNGEMTFPNGGSASERDHAVAEVLGVLRNEPERFEVLTRAH